MQNQNQYWIHREGKNLGPFVRTQVNQFINDGRFALDDLCCMQGSKEWLRIKDYFDSFKPPPPPPSPKKVPRINPNEFILFYRKSWTAYLIPCLLWAFFSFWGLLTLGIFGFIIYFIFWGIPFGLWIFSIRKYLLYTDSKGVWLSYGIFPWTKGVVGVLWRDLNECVFENSFFGWLFKSYTIIASNRFTKSSEIKMSHTKNGKLAIQEMNSLHHKYLNLSGEQSSPLEG